MKIIRPHVWLVIDFRWVGILAGLAYYDVSYDSFRPAFVEFQIWQRWRITFEAGKISSYWSRR